MMRKLIKATTMLLLVSVMLLSVIACTSEESDTGNTGAILIPLDQSSTDWIRANDSNIIQLVNMMLEEGVPVQWALEDFSVDGIRYPAGTFYIPTPFVTDNGITSAKLHKWLQWEAKRKHVYTISYSEGIISVKSKKLIMPRIVLFYDDTTYENCLQHYTRMSDLGFKVQLATAPEINEYNWDDPAGVLTNANVFAMPGGALHFWSFLDQQKGIENISQFVENGGGYIGVCAGSSEALSKSPFPYLPFLDANYYAEWFVNEKLSDGDWDWRNLIGPIFLEINDPHNPVMFGYGEGAVRPGYGVLTTMYYYGGPAMHDLDEEARSLASYSSPVTQRTSEKVANIWGSTAIATQSYGKGEVVLFGPHPEWPGPCARMYAQALYFSAGYEVSSTIEPVSVSVSMDKITDERVDTITDTVTEIKPILEEITRMAADVVNLKAGDHYHPLGMWYDESIMAYGQEMYKQLNAIQYSALKFQFEYARLQLLLKKTEDITVKTQIIDTLGMIELFYQTAENMQTNDKVVGTTDWSGAGPFERFPDELEPVKFEDLVPVFEFIKMDMETSAVPTAHAYAKLFHEYEDLRLTCEIEGTDESNAACDEFYNKMAAESPPGDMYKVQAALAHVLKSMQYKADYPLLNILTVANRANETIAMTNYVAASNVGRLDYAVATTEALLANPIGGILP